MRRLLLFTLALAFFTSCVSKKQLTYLQEPEDSEEGTNDTLGYYKLQRTQYEVQPNDILSITVRSFDVETSKMFNSQSGQAQNFNAGDLLFYLQGYTVDMTGYIEIPVIGKLYVSGLNIEEVKLLVENKLNDFFKEEAVQANVQLAGVRFSVIGEVNRPGKYVIYQNQVNIFEALASSGDITTLGRRNAVQIVRQTSDGGVKIIDVDLNSSEVLKSPYFFIQPNDIINVKPLGVKSIGIGETAWGTFQSIVTVLAASATLIVAINAISGN